jgi:hypothetical protein
MGQKRTVNDPFYQFGLRYDHRGRSGGKGRWRESFRAYPLKSRATKVRGDLAVHENGQHVASLTLNLAEDVSAAIQGHLLLRGDASHDDSDPDLLLNQVFQLFYRAPFS